MSALFVDTKYSWRMAEEHIDISVGAECGGTAPPVCTGTTEHRCTLALGPDPETSTGGHTLAAAGHQAR